MASASEGQNPSRFNPPVQNRMILIARVPLACPCTPHRKRDAAWIWLHDSAYFLDHPEDALLHALRIECKMLRYQLEFFTSLFPPKEISRQIKRLQDNLGDFNDLTVQQAHLLQIVEELDVGDPRTRKALVAIGILVEKMAGKQQTVKTKFADTFSVFASRTHPERFRQ